jgi:ABC-type nickel/cobalt efflux system permease component RcnA
MTGASEAAHATAFALGALHGLEPGHGWTVAAVYALGRRSRWRNGLVAGTLIGGAHLVSSFAVVAAFSLLDRWLAITETAGVTRAAGLVLVAMGLVQWLRARGHAHTGHHHDLPPGEGAATARAGLLGLAAFAFVLGFAHEEEFAVLALCAGRTSCWGVMAVYALAVAGVILALTLVSVAAFERFHRLERWHDRLPRISAAILMGIGLLYILRVL